MLLAPGVMGQKSDKSDNELAYVAKVEEQTMQANYSSDRRTDTPISRIELKEKLVRELAGSNYMAAEELRVLLKVRRETSKAR
jgi:hypothetical protein